MQALRTLIASTISAIPIGFAFGFIPLVLEGLKKAQKPEPAVTPGKIMDKLNRLQAQMDTLIEMQSREK